MTAGRYPNMCHRSLLHRTVIGNNCGALSRRLVRSRFPHWVPPSIVTPSRKAGRLLNDDAMNALNGSAYETMKWRIGSLGGEMCEAASGIIALHCIALPLKHRDAPTTPYSATAYCCARYKLL